MFQSFLSACWDDHAQDASAVYSRLREGPTLATELAHLAALSSLVVHVAGEHLGRWEDGLSLLDDIERSPLFDARDPLGRAVRRSRSVLLWCAGRRAESETVLASAIDPARPEGSSAGRVLALAASALAGQRRTEEADLALTLALQAAAYGPTAEDPLAKMLAITGNNLASALEERADRSLAETAQMKRAAMLGRIWWSIAGDWTNIVLADVRLAATHLAAGEPDIALQHALSGLALADNHRAGPDDRLAPLVMIARSRAAGGDPLAASARVEALAVLAEVSTQLRSWYAPLLEG